MANDLMVFDNSIVTSSYKLSVNELRLIYCALVQMPKNTKDEPSEQIDPKTPFYITREDFLSVGACSSQVAREIRQATKDLLKRTIKVQTPAGELEFPWLSEVLRYDALADQKLREMYPNDEDYNNHINTLRLYNLYEQFTPDRDDDNIVARLVFNEKIIPLLSGLQDNFTKVFIEDVKQFKSMYSHRIYQLMMQFRETGFVVIPLEKLRTMLMINNKYSNTKDLRRRVIDVAIAEINETSPYDVEYELIKKGRAFNKLKLNFKLKQTAVENKQNEQKGMTEDQASYFGKLLGFDLAFGLKHGKTEKTKKELAERVSVELLQPKYVEKYKKFLDEFGYNPNYKK